MEQVIQHASEYVKASLGGTNDDRRRQALRSPKLRCSFGEARRRGHPFYFHFKIEQLILLSDEIPAHGSPSRDRFASNQHLDRKRGQCHLCCGACTLQYLIYAFAKSDLSKYTISDIINSTQSQHQMTNPKYRCAFSATNKIQ